MSPRALEILARLDAIDLEAITLRKELRKELETEQGGSIEQAKFSMFKATTSRLLTEFLNAPNNILSYDDIRLYVMFDEEASGAAVRSVIKRARKALRVHHDCPYEIKSVSRHGYKLENVENGSNCVKKQNNSTKKRKP